MSLRARCTLLLVLILSLGIQASMAADLRVAVAANFTDAMRDLEPIFERQTGHDISISYGSTGKLYAQIENGAPFDVFLAADEARPRRALAHGLALDGTAFEYARGQLVAWGPQMSSVEEVRNALMTGDLHRLANTNPATAPYGLAGEQVLESLGVLHRFDGKIVQGDSIAQTFQFVATQNAEVGFVALSQILAWTGQQGAAWIVPDDMYSPIVQYAVQLERSADNPVASQFLQFLRSPLALDVIRGYGYGADG